MRPWTLAVAELVTCSTVAIVLVEVVGYQREKYLCLIGEDLKLEKTVSSENRGTRTVKLADQQDRSSQSSSNTHISDS